MPTLNWIGKDAVVKHHQEVPFHLLNPRVMNSTQAIQATQALARSFNHDEAVRRAFERRLLRRKFRHLACPLSPEEAESLQASRSQIATLKRGQNLKYPPYAFTEHGAIMPATVLNSPEAVKMSVFVNRITTELMDEAVDFVGTRADGKLMEEFRCAQYLDAHPSVRF